MTESKRISAVRRQGVRCEHCSVLIPTRASILVHQRDCRPRISKDEHRVEKGVKRLRLFGNEPGGLGAGGALRREDLGLVVAAADLDEVTPQLDEATPQLDSDELEDGAEWTTEATAYEVTEAMKHVLLNIGSAMGAKTADQVVKLIRHPSWCMDSFKGDVYSHRQLASDASKQVEDELLSLRFRKEVISDTGGEEAVANMWLRDPVDVVRRQIATLAHDKHDVNRLLLNCASVRQSGDDGKPLYSHPMSTPLAETVFDRVRGAVMTACARGDPHVDGWDDDYDFVLLLQLYSDKSSQTLKTNSHTHFPIHVASMNCSLTAKEKLIRKGDCVVGYLPTDIFWEDEEAAVWENEREDAVSGRGSRGSRLRILQSALAKCLDPILSRTLTGFDVRDSTGLPMRCHPVLWSYVTDMPEGWDISSGVHHRCSRCEVTKDDLCSTQACTRKDASFIIPEYNELERLQGPRQPKGRMVSYREAMWKRGIAPVRPYLLSLGDNYGVDIFRCLRYEMMHNIHLGLTRTLLECMSERLRSTDLSSPEFPYASAPRNPKKFSTIRTTVLRSLNNAMELMDRQSPTIDFKVCFKSNKRTVPLNGLFQKDGLASMLEANDYARVLQIMPFLAATCDRLCGEPGTTTRLFVDYVELVYCLTRDKQHSVAFSDKDLRKLKVTIRKFMLSSQELFAGHSKSELALPKMHALMHVLDDMAEGGLLAHYVASAFEEAHKIIKEAFEGGSRRGEDGHVEAMGTIERDEFSRKNCGRTRGGARVDVVKSLSRPRSRVVGARTKTKEAALEGDCVEMTRGHLFVPSHIVLRFMSYYRGHGCLAVAQKWPNWVPVGLRYFVRDVGGPRAFVWFMKKLSLGPNDSLTRSTSVYASGFPSPVQVRNTKSKLMLITKGRSGSGDAVDGEVEREFQRIVSAHSFHGSQHPVQNFVMIEAADPEATMKQIHHSVRQKYASSSVRSVWVAKVLAFVTHKASAPVGPGEVPGKPREARLALVQYMNVCQEKRDDVDKTLGCTKLRWAREDDDEDYEENADDMRCVYDVVDVSTIRGLVHVVRGDYGLGCTKTYECEGDRHWSKCWFYVNRFKLGRRHAGVFMEETP